jgi:choline-sulfatase
MQPQNLMIIMSDEHSRAMSSCYGHPLIKTPNLDRLTARGTVFSQAYTPCPVCVPARAAFAIGKYNHQIGFWDNADPYDGSIPSWHHRLREAGHQVVSIGKLHFRSEQDDNGFSEEIVPMHVIEGKGDLMGLVREDLPRRGMSWKMARLAGPGESPYTLYDRQISAHTYNWLHDEAPKYKDKPWVLFVSYVSPHFPLTAPPEYFFRYFDDPKLPMPKLYNAKDRPKHPFLDDYSGSFNYDDHFKSEEDVRRAVAGYFGLCSFVDEQIGKVLLALEQTGFRSNTRVLYTSDHGDNLGARGLWGKSTMYEESASVPLIIAGEEIPSGKRIDVPVTLLDVYPFIMECVGELGSGMIEPDHPGVSLASIARGIEPLRTVLSEYHGMGSTTGAFMIRSGRYKYVYYVAYRPQLFDLVTDPEELHDLADDPAYAKVLQECEGRLRQLLDPEEVDARAKRRQLDLMTQHGGREAVIKRGDLGFTPPPGYRPDLG